MSDERKDEFAELQEFRRKGATPSETWAFILRSQRHQAFWVQTHPDQGVLDLEMWRFLLGSKRLHLVMEWEEKNPHVDPLSIDWFRILQEVPWIGVKAARMLNQLKKDSARILSLILKTQDRAEYLRHYAIGELEDCALEPSRFLPILIQTAQDPSYIVRFKAINILKNLGKKATPAIPVLEEILKQSSDDFHGREVRKRVKDALENIRK